MQEVYMIYLSGQGDVDIKLVDKETFDWLSAPSGQPKPFESSWEDPNVPAAVKERIFKDLPDDEREIRITFGSWHNDRAIFAQSVYGDFDDLTSAIQFIQERGYKLVDTFEGGIY